MADLFNFFIVTFSILGWYILIKEIMYHMLYKNIDDDKNIKYQIIVENSEENIEVYLRKILYIQTRFGCMKNIEIIDNNSNDETYQILEKIQEEYPSIKVRKIL